MASIPPIRYTPIRFDRVSFSVYQTADEDMLNQVWTNLVHNALKFTPAGGRIGSELRLEGGQALVRLTDSGIGIRFYKADKARSRTDASGGSGLGLAIARKIVELHHGSKCTLTGGDRRCVGVFGNQAQVKTSHANVLRSSCSQSTLGICSFFGSFLSADSGATLSPSSLDWGRRRPP